MTTSPRPSVWYHVGFAGCLLFACGDNTDAGSPARADAAPSQAGSPSGSGEVAADSGVDSGPATAQTRDVRIRFRGAVGEQDFSCQKQYEQLGSTKVRAAPADFRFYVQDVKLIAADGSEVPVKLDKRAPWQTPDVALVDFEDMTGLCHGTPETNEYISGTVPAGTYDGLVFTNGVPEALNHQEQSSLSAPLDLTDMYWAWLSGFRFFVLEFQEADTGAVATDADAGIELPGIGLLHVGSTACRQGDGCKKQNRNVIRLPNFDPDTDVIVADAAAVFVETDLTQDMQCHSSDDLCAPMYKHVGVSWDTGDSLPEQQVFHVAPGGVERNAGAGGRAGKGGAGGSAGAAGGGGAAGGASTQGTMPVTIRFKARMGEQDFACGKSFANLGSNSSTVTPQDMRLFVHELTLIEEDGTRVPVTFDVRAPWQSETVALLDFENQTGNCVDGTRGTNSELTGRVPEGSYAGVSFKGGVPEEINHADPTTLSDPLVASATLRWSWQAGFRFAKIELANTVAGENDLGRAYFHPGATGCTGNPMQGTVDCAKPNRNEVVFEAFDLDSDTIVIDVAELFKNSDLEQVNECHSTPQTICAPMFDAWGLNWANGATKPGQTVFKLQ